MSNLKIIAELCQNHMGEISIVDEMVHAAKESGADFAKIQSMRSKDLVHRARFDTGIIEGGSVNVIKRPFSKEYTRLKNLDLTEEEHFKFIEICKKYKIEPMSTIFSRNRIKLFKKLNFKRIKISSFDCSSHQMIREIRENLKSDLIVSTGATYDYEIEKTAKILGRNKFTILHCISNYPTTPDVAFLSRIKYLKKFSNKVGFSDHSNPEIYKNDLALISIGEGAQLIERHFTILGKDKTKDGPVSVNPKQLKSLCELKKISNKDIKLIIKKKFSKKKLFKILGRYKREFSKTEILNRDYYRGRFASKSKNSKIVFNWDENFKLRDIKQV